MLLAKLANMFPQHDLSLLVEYRIMLFEGK